MKKLIIYPFFLIIVFAASACEDSLGVDNNLRSREKGYYWYWPLKQDNYYLADIYAIDKFTTRTGEIILKDGRLIFEDTVLVDSKPCINYSLYSNDTLVWKFPVYSNGSKIWIYSFEYDGIRKTFRDKYNLNLPWPSDDSLWLLADLSRDSWNGFPEQQFIDFKMADTAYLSVKFSYTGWKHGHYRTVFGGKETDVMIIKTRFIFNGTATIKGVEKDVDYIFEDEIHFAYGIGMIREINPLTMADLGLGEFPIGGAEIDVKEAYIQEE